MLYGELRGSHVLGYDDNFECYSGERGAFKFINSWGKDWGVGGYGWISYDMFLYIDVNNFGKETGFIIDTHDGAFYENGFIYSVSENEAEITGYTGSGGEVKIPESI